MDISLLKTFIEVYRTRHFGKAAENLHLTQSAVSARIKNLEEFIGTELFTRTRNAIELTSAGDRFIRHAEVILTAWSKARQDIAAFQGLNMSLAVGGMYSLWDILLEDWINKINKKYNNLALMLEAQSHEFLLRKVIDGALDIGFMFEAPQVMGLIEREVNTINLVMVSSENKLQLSDVFDQNYIYVDWGISFSHEHARCFPDIHYPNKRVSHGRLALSLLLNCGGTAYLAEKSTDEYLNCNKLFRVEDAPIISRKAYAVFNEKTDKGEFITELLEFFD